MLLKAVISTAMVPAEIITLRLLSIQSDTSIAKTSKQLVKWYRDIIT